MSSFFARNGAGELLLARPADQRLLDVLREAVELAKEVRAVADYFEPASSEHGQVIEIHGIATAAGCQLVATCDLAAAADNARFGQFRPRTAALPRKAARRRATFRQESTGRCWSMACLPASVRGPVG